MKKITGIILLLLIWLIPLHSLEVKLEAFLEFDDIVEEEREGYISIMPVAIKDVNNCWVFIDFLTNQKEMSTSPARVNFDEKKYILINDNEFRKNTHHLRRLKQSKRSGIVFFIYDIKTNYSSNLSDDSYIVEFDIQTGEGKKVSLEYFEAEKIPELFSLNFFTPSYFENMGNGYTILTYFDDQTYVTEGRSEDSTVKLGIVKNSFVNKIIHRGNGRFDFTSDREHMRDKLEYTFLDERDKDLLLYSGETNVVWSSSGNYLAVATDFTSIDDNALKMDNFRMYVYYIIYDGIINDTRVRLRSKPDLSSAVLGYVNTGDKVKILDRSNEKEKIENMFSYWYKVEHADGKTGWMYGAYVDVEKPK